MRTIHVLLAGNKIDDKTSIVVPGILIIHALFHIDIHTADRIHNALKRRGVNNDVMAHLDTKQSADR